MMLHDNAEKVVEYIKGHEGLFIQGGAATPEVLINALVKRSDYIGNLEIFHLHTHGAAPHQNVKNFKVTNLFVGSNIRRAMDYERIDYLPCFLSEIPALLESGVRRFDVAMIHVSPPDEHGYCSLGVSVDIVLSAIKHSKLVIAQINSKMPRTHGDGIIHISHIDHAVEVEVELEEVKSHGLTAEEIQIGKNVAEIIEDGSTLQMGIGAIPDGVLQALQGHKDLGVHTEMFSNGLIPLLEKGVVNNKKKRIHPGKTVAGFAMGDKKLYDFVHDNPSTVFLDISYVNHPNVIKRNPKVVAINSAVEIDLTGQVCADSIGSRIISGVGGQMDFMRGAALSLGGKPIIALTSRTQRGEARIVPILKPGAGVVTTRQHVHYVATEYGVATLYGKTIGERVKALTEIAHPDDRENMEKRWRDNFKL